MATSIAVRMEPMDYYNIVFGQLLALFPLLTLGTGVYFLRRLIKALERRAENKAELAEVRARIAQLEEAHDAMERDVLRLQASQEFASRLLAARIDEAK